MKRITQLNNRLHPYATVQPDREDTVNSLPPNIWSKLLNDAPKLSGFCSYWFKAGLLRAIAEMQRKREDGSPLFRTRQELIDHLKTIDRP